MKIHILVKTKARVESIKRIDDSTLAVSVKELPIDGKANMAVIKVLANYYSIPKSRVHLLSGETSKHKVFSIEDTLGKRNVYFGMRLAYTPRMTEQMTPSDAFPHINLENREEHQAYLGLEGGRTYWIQATYVVEQEPRTVEFKRTLEQDEQYAIAEGVRLMILADESKGGEEAAWRPIAVIDSFRKRPGHDAGLEYRNPLKNVRVPFDPHHRVKRLIRYGFVAVT